MIVIIDSGIGNIKSIFNMLKKVGCEAAISNKADTILRAKKIILPGVGSFDAGMANLNNYGLVDILNEKILKKKAPILGICLGMQMFCKNSEEGKLPGLGWIDAKVARFNFDEQENSYKIPHMGWASIEINRPHQLFQGLKNKNRFYFVHSYHIVVNKPEIELSTTRYGYKFTSAIALDNILGVQFHPEKSHKFGMLILKNFAES